MRNDLLSFDTLNSIANHKRCEKLCRFTGNPGTRRWLKRMLRRLRRRTEKLDPENAPTSNRQYIRGWSD